MAVFIAEEACRQLLDDRGLSTIVDIAKDSNADENIRAFSALVLSGLTALSGECLPTVGHNEMTKS